MSFFKKSFGVIKYGPSVVSGIKKTLSAGRVILDISKDAVSRIRTIAPHLADQIERITHNPTFQKIENGVRIGDAVVNRVVPQKPIDTERFINPDGRRF